MAALPDARPLFTAQGLRLSLAAAAAAALGGCGGVPYASSDPAFPGSFEQRHPIVVAAAPTSVDLYPVGGRLDERSRANVRAFAERYRRYGSGAVMIQTPVGTNPNSIAVYEVRRALLAAGVRGRIAVRRLSAAERRRSAAGARVVHGAQGDRSDAMRSVAGGSRFGVVGRRMEERTLLELRLRHPIDDRGPGRRPARFRPAARDRPIRRRHAHPSHRGRPQRPGSEHRLDRTPCSRQSAAICRPTDTD